MSTLTTALQKANVTHRDILRLLQCLDAVFTTFLAACCWILTVGGRLPSTGYQCMTELRNPPQKAEQASPANGKAEASVSESPSLTKSRPVLFKKPTRKEREQQQQALINQFCTLSFDDVDPSSQMALTCRMLATLRSLTSSVSHWDGSERHEEEAFHLLGLEQADMDVVMKVAQSATDLIEAQRHREAYNVLCRVRVWFLGDTSDVHRAQLRATTSESLDEDLQSTSLQRSSSPLPSAPRNVQAIQIQLNDRNKVEKLPSEQNMPLEAPAPPSKDIQQPLNNVLSGARAQTDRAPQQASCGRPVAPNTRRSEGEGKLLARFEVGIEEDAAFQVCRRLIGPGGKHMKRIVGECPGTKLRIRGRGSKYLEGPKQQESPDPLMICVSVAVPENFERVTSMVEQLLATVHTEYKEFCRYRRNKQPDLPMNRGVQLHSS